MWRNLFCMTFSSFIACLCSLEILDNDLCWSLLPWLLYRPLGADQWGAMVACHDHSWWRWWSHTLWVTLMSYDHSCLVSFLELTQWSPWSVVFLCIHILDYDPVFHDSHLSVVECSWEGYPRWYARALEHSDITDEGDVNWYEHLKLNGMLWYSGPDLKLLWLDSVCAAYSWLLFMREQINQIPILEYHFLWNGMAHHSHSWASKCNGLLNIHLQFSHASSRYRSSVRWYPGPQFSSQ